MKKVEIELGESGPTGSVSMAATEAPEKYYPTVTYTSDEEIKLPESGCLLIEFKKVESRESSRNGKETHSCTFEVRKIVGIEGKEDCDDSDNAGKAKNEAGDALDKLRDDYVKTKKKGY